MTPWPPRRQLMAALSLKADPKLQSVEGEEAPRTLWDVSNLRRLGRSEVELVNGVIAGLRRLLGLEEVLTDGGGDAAADEQIEAIIAAAGGSEQFVSRDSSDQVSPQPS